VDWNLAVEEQRSVSERFVCPSEDWRKSSVSVISLSFFLRDALKLAILDEITLLP
jgi:hypothetical protein